MRNRIVDLEEYLEKEFTEYIQRLNVKDIVENRYQPIRKWRPEKGGDSHIYVCSEGS